MKRTLVIGAVGAAIALGTLPAVASTAHPNTKPANNCTFQGTTYKLNDVKKAVAEHPALETWLNNHSTVQDALYSWIKAGCPRQSG